MKNSGLLDLSSSTASGNSALLGVASRTPMPRRPLPTPPLARTATLTTFAGGIWSQSGDINMFGTVITNRINGDCRFFTGIMSATYPIIESMGAEACDLTNTNGNLIGQDPLLEPLADNGGPTLTYALQPYNPALDKISFGLGGCDTTYTTDQWGVQRPQGDACDMAPMNSSAIPLCTCL